MVLGTQAINSYLLFYIYANKLFLEAEEVRNIIPAHIVIEMKPKPETFHSLATTNIRLPFVSRIIAHDTALGATMMPH